MVYKYQQGGAAPQQDPREQIKQVVIAAMRGDQKATQMIQQVMQAAQQGDQQAAQIAQMILEVMQELQGGQAQMQRHGGNLSHIHKLNTGCPQGEEPYYFRVGGRVCKKCMKKNEKGASIQENKCGGKAKKMENGGRKYFDKDGNKIKK